MKLKDRTAIVTGAANGIGYALAERFVREGAKAVILADVQKDALEQAAARIGGHAIPCDVTNETEVRSLIEETERRFGPVDIYMSNAGVVRFGTETTPDEDWDLNWRLHVLAHVYAARVLMPKMTQRGGGYFVITSSAAGLLSHIKSASYAVTKHGAVAFAEYLSITYGDKGVRVSVLCPQQVRTPMTADLAGTVSSVDGRLEPEQLADCVIDAMDTEQFLILPHPKVLKYLQRKTADYDGWLAGMRRLNTQYD